MNSLKRTIKPAGYIRRLTRRQQSLELGSLFCVSVPPACATASWTSATLSQSAANSGRGLEKKDSFHLVVLRSTVLPGTAENIVVPTLEKASGKRMGKDFGVCVNPEFMCEGTAVADFLDPAITIIGADHPEHAAFLRAVYAWTPGRIFETSFRSVEMVKYVCNAWHALKVSFANEVGTLAKQLGVDAEAVMVPLLLLVLRTAMRQTSFQNPWLYSYSFLHRLLGLRNPRHLVSVGLARTRLAPLFSMRVGGANTRVPFPRIRAGCHAS